MKKYFLVVLCAVLVFVVTGCGNKNQVKCTGSFSEGGMNMDAEVIADLDDADKVVDVTAIMDLKDKDTASQFCSLYKMFADEEKGIEISCSGSKITIKGFSKLEAETEEDDVTGKAKEEFIKAMEEEEFTCK